MKIKKTQLEQLINEEVKIFLDKKYSLLKEDVYSDLNERNNFIEQAYGRLLSNLGAEKLLSELMNRIDKKKLLEIFEQLLKMYNIRAENKESEIVEAFGDKNLSPKEEATLKDFVSRFLNAQDLRNNRGMSRGGALKFYRVDDYLEKYINARRQVPLAKENKSL